MRKCARISGRGSDKLATLGAKDTRRERQTERDIERERKIEREREREREREGKGKRVSETDSQRRRF